VAAITVFLSEFDNVLRAFLPDFLIARLDFAPDLDELVTTGWQGPVLAVLIAPLTEEFVFRGLILRGLLGRWRPVAAITASAALFAATHLNPAQAPVALLLGVILGWIYVRTRSLGLCVLGHALNNAATYVSEFPFEVRGFNALPETDGAIFHPWWFNATGLLLLMGGIWWIRRHAPAAMPWQRVPAAVTPTAEPPLLPPPLLPAAPAVGGCQAGGSGESRGAMSGEVAQLVTSLAQRARAASFTLATTPRAAKDAALRRLADLIDASGPELLAANARDLASPEAAALTPAARDRLTLNEARLRQLAESVREVAALEDPVGKVLEETTRPNGLRLRKVRVPIGVIGIIYESRPNVTIDCAVLCLRPCCAGARNACTPTSRSRPSCSGPSRPPAFRPTPCSWCPPPTGRRSPRCCGWTTSSTASSPAAAKASSATSRKTAPSPSSSTTRACASCTSTPRLTSRWRRP